LSQKSEIEPKNFLKGQGASDAGKEVVEEEARILELRESTALATSLWNLVCGCNAYRNAAERVQTTAKANSKANEIAQRKQRVK
jgi:hypothetical protein